MRWCNFLARGSWKGEGVNCPPSPPGCKYIQGSKKILILMSYCHKQFIFRMSFSINVIMAWFLLIYLSTIFWSSIIIHNLFAHKQQNRCTQTSVGFKNFEFSIFTYELFAGTTLYIIYSWKWREKKFEKSQRKKRRNVRNPIASLTPTFSCIS